MTLKRKEQSLLTRVVALLLIAPLSLTSLAACMQPSSTPSTALKDIRPEHVDTDGSQGVSNASGTEQSIAVGSVPGTAAASYVGQPQPAPSPAQSGASHPSHHVRNLVIFVVALTVMAVILGSLAK